MFRRPICAKCCKEMRPLKNEVIVKYMMSKGTQPYEVFMADLWHCPKCNNQIIRGFGQNPVWEHWDKDKRDLDKFLSCYEPKYIFEIK